MVNGDVILRKLEKLRECIDALRDAHDITWEIYEKNNRDRAFVERYLHIAIQIREFIPEYVKRMKTNLSDVKG